MQRLSFACMPVAVWVGALCLVMLAVLALGVIYAVGCVPILFVTILRSRLFDLGVLLAIVCLVIWITR
jgi:hypothetical protein